MSPATHPDGGRGESLVAGGITLVLGVTSFVASFSHVREIATRSGQTGWVAWAIAGTVDLLAIGGGLELRRRRRLGQNATWPWVTLLLGVGMTLAANVATATPTAWGFVMAAWPAIAFLAVAGLIETRGDRTPTTTRARRHRTGTPTNRDAAATTTTTTRDNARDTAARDVPAPVPVTRDTGTAQAGTVTPIRRALPAGTRPATDSDSDDRAARMRAWVLDAWAEGREVSGGELDRQFGTKDYGRRIIRQLRDDRPTSATAEGGNA